MGSGKGNDNEGGLDYTVLNRCPYCLAPMEEGLRQHQLPIRLFCIFDAVSRAGPEGISLGDILERCLPGKKEATVRSAVYYINANVSPMKLVGRGGRYYLERNDWDKEK